MMQAFSSMFLCLTGSWFFCRMIHWLLDPTNPKNGEIIFATGFFILAIIIAQATPAESGE